MRLQRWSPARVRAACFLISAACFVGCSDAPEKAATPAGVVSAASRQVQAQQHVAAAKRLAGEGNYEAAVVEYTAALDKLGGAAIGSPGSFVPDSSIDPGVLFERGVAYLHLGFPDTAAADLTAVLRLRPDDGAAYAKRGEAYAKLGDLYKAVRDCTDAIRYKPDEASAYRYRGQAYLGRVQFERAVADMERAIELDPALQAELQPMLAKAYLNWSKQLARAGETADADAKLARARELDPTIAVADAAEPGASGAGDAVERTAAKQIIDDAVQFYERGLIALGEGRTDEALSAFTAAIEARRDFADAYLQRGETLLLTGFPDTAVKDLELAVHYGSAAIEAHRLLAEAFLQLGNPHRAALSATDALHVDPTDAASYALRGRAYVELGKWDRGLVDLREAIRRDPTLADDLQPALDRAVRQRARGT